MSSGNGEEGAAKGALYGLLALGGALVGLIGTFQYNRDASRPLVSCLLVLACTFVAIRAAGWAAGTRTGALIPAVTWVITTSALSVGRSEGDILVAGNAYGLLFLFGGLAVALGAVLLTPAHRSFFTGLPR
ncbi:hypothetical protein GCM10022221_07870 [Actinocorallia aurea]